MGLDIYLIRITKEPRNELNWLPASENPELKERYREFLTQKIIELENEPDFKDYGYFYEDLAYQRKGVKSTFYDEYQPDEFLFKRQELEKLKSHIENDYLDSFTRDFIDNFKEGDTLVMISY